MPLVQLVILGNAFGGKIRGARVAVVDHDHGPQAVGEALEARLGGDWSRLAKHLSEAAAVGETELAPRSALALVRALAEDEAEVRAALKPRVVELASV